MFVKVADRVSVLLVKPLFDDGLAASVHAVEEVSMLAIIIDLDGHFGLVECVHWHRPFLTYAH